MELQKIVFSSNFIIQKKVTQKSETGIEHSNNANHINTHHKNILSLYDTALECDDSCQFEIKENKNLIPKNN